MRLRHFEKRAELYAALSRRDKLNFALKGLSAIAQGIALWKWQPRKFAPKGQEQKIRKYYQELPLLNMEYD